MGEFEQLGRDFRESQVAEVNKTGFLLALLGDQPPSNEYAIHVGHAMIGIIRGTRRFLSGKVLLNR